MKRLFTALLAAVFALVLSAPIHSAIAAGKDEVVDPQAASDNAMSGEKGEKSEKKGKHHHGKKHHAKAHAEKTAHGKKDDKSKEGK